MGLEDTRTHPYETFRGTRGFLNLIMYLGSPQDTDFRLAFGLKTLNPQTYLKFWVVGCKS